MKPGDKFTVEQRGKYGPEKITFEVTEDFEAKHTAGPYTAKYKTQNDADKYARSFKR